MAVASIPEDALNDPPAPALEVELAADAPEADEPALEESPPVVLALEVVEAPLAAIEDPEVSLRLEDRSVDERSLVALEDRSVVEDAPPPVVEDRSVEDERSLVALGLEDWVLVEDVPPPVVEAEVEAGAAVLAQEQTCKLSESTLLDHERCRIIGNYLGKSQDPLFGFHLRSETFQKRY